MNKKIDASAVSSGNLGKIFAKAIKDGDLQTFTELVDQTILSQIVDTSTGNSFLHLAADSRICVSNLIMVQALLFRGGDLTARNASGETPLMLATDAKVIKALIDAGADPNARDNDGNNAIMGWGRTWVGEEALVALISGGSDLKAINSHGNTILMMYSSPDRIRTLIAAGADPDFENPDGKTALMHWSAATGNINHILQTLKQLLSCGARIDKVDKEGKDALRYAVGQFLDNCIMFGANRFFVKAIKSELRIVRFLLSKGAVLSRKSSNGKTAFGHALASKGCNDRLLRVLIEAGADINERVLKAGVSVSAFGHFLKQGDVLFCIWLLEKGAQLNERTLGVLGGNWAELSTIIRENEENSASGKSTLLTNLVKICMAVPQLFKSRITATDPDLGTALHELVQKSTQQPEATDDELPDLLKSGNWPPEPQIRSPLMLEKPNHQRYLPKKLPDMSRFLDVGLFPAPLLADSEKRLPRTAIQALVGMMSISTYDAQHPGLEAITAFLDRQSLVKFSWAVFEQWNERGDSSNNWMFHGLAYFGDDVIVRRLTPYIRNWSAQRRIARARMGLKVLADIGTDYAIAQIQAISLKNRYKLIQKRAQALLEVIAEARGLTAEQLEDRLVPDFGLDAEGKMTLDFGQRQFKVTFDERLNPLLLDSEGKQLKILPKATKDDDKDIAKAASLAWAELKKELKPVAGIQIMRMEAAMVGERYWTGDEFKRLLVAHPLMRHLVSRLVWATFTGKGKFKSTFRVSDSGSLVNIKDAPFELADDSLVGIPHPLQFEAELEEWKKCFSRLKLSQPFPQIVRKTYAEIDDTGADYFGLQGAVVPSKSLKGLKALGWESKMIGIRDFIGGFTRSFPSGTADLAIEPGVSITGFNFMSDEQILEVRLPKLSPVAYSEVIRELMLMKK